MSFRNSTHQGVRRVVVDNLGDGSVTVEPGVQPDLVECSINAGRRGVPQRGAGPPGAATRCGSSFPPNVFRNTATPTCGSAYPPDLEYVIKVGSADVSVSADIGRSKISSGSGDINVGRAVDLECSTGSGGISVGYVERIGSPAVLRLRRRDVAEADCPVTAKSGSGDVTVKSVPHSAVQANSGSGDIAVASTPGTVDLRTASGSLTVGVADQLPAWLDLTRSSGRGPDRPGARLSQPAPRRALRSVEATTASGDIAVYRA